MALGWACNLNDIFVRFPYEKCKSLMDKIKMSQMLEDRWHKQCAQARVKQLSQNDMDAILEVGASWDRKRFGKGYKPLR